MARIRTIKPEFPQSESMGRVSREARLLFILLWTISDDEGRARASSRMLASLLYPYDDDAKNKIGKWLEELHNEKCITLYEVDGNSYLQIEKWLVHQRIDKASKSRLPSPVANIREASTNSSEASAADLGPRTSDLGKEKIDQPRASRFGEFWIVCPKKVGKGKASSLFERACKETSPDLLIAAMQKYAAAQVGKDSTYIAHPATWLSQRRWEDEDSPPAGASNVLSFKLDEATQREEAENIKRFKAQGLIP